MSSYTVQSGDTLWAIGNKHSVGWRTLAAVNDIKSPNLIRPGQVIVIPAAGELRRLAEKALSCITYVSNYATLAESLISVGKNPSSYEIKRALVDIGIAAADVAIFAASLGAGVLFAIGTALLYASGAMDAFKDFLFSNKR